ncbi:Farnesol dehydrogenase [Blattella germanica]|nr:Farnesol dehydrogenase [Blattella germanica]
MDRWVGRVAVVTGTSSGIGAAIAELLVKKGLKVVGLARRVERELSKSLKSEKGELHPLKCDVTKEGDIKEAFQWVKANLGGVDIMINNAAVAKGASLIDGSPDELRNMVDLNIMGLSLCTQEALKSMKERGVDGHIVHINR